MVVKYLFMWKDDPDKSLEEIEEHYQKVHTTLARKAYLELDDSVLDGFIKYNQNRVVNFEVDDYNQGETREAEPPFNRMCEVWFESEEQLREAFDTEMMEDCFHDHENFMNTDIEENLHVYKLEEKIALEKDPQTEQLKLGLTRADGENFGIDGQEVDRQRESVGAPRP